MMLAPAGVKIHIALGVTDLRKGVRRDKRAFQWKDRPPNGLAMLVQGVLEQDPFSGHLFAFRGRRANLIKILFWDGTGLCVRRGARTDGALTPHSPSGWRRGDSHGRLPARRGTRYH